MSVEVNRPEVVAEIKELSAAYDKALLSNDVDALTGFFWDDAMAQRFGTTEELYGADEISAFRKARVVNFSGRKNVRETVVTFGNDFAISSTEFAVTVNGSPRHGRQSQQWVRFAGSGWKIVSAHVSHRLGPDNAAAFDQGKAGAYVAATAAFLDMPIDPQFAPGVVRDLENMAKVVAPLMELDLSEIEPAAKFTA